jgi:hypothetical protein
LLTGEGGGRDWRGAETYDRKKTYPSINHSILLSVNLCLLPVKSSVPEIIDPVFAKTSQNARFLLSENERFGLVFVKTGSINSGTGVLFAAV